MSSSRVRILHIQKVAGIAGSENHLLALLPGLQKRGYEPTMLVLAGIRDRPGLFVDRMRDAGVPTALMRMVADLDPLLLPRLVRFIGQGAYPIVHTHLIHADLYGVLAARIGGIRLAVSTRHNDDAFRTLGPLRFLIAWSTRYCDHVVCVSESVRRFSESVERTPPYKMTVVNYGFCPDGVQGDRGWREQFGWSDDVPVLGIVARLTAQKGHTTLLYAMRDVVRKFPATQLVIVGGGELRGELERCARTLGIDDHTHFMGHHDRAAAMMSGFDVFVHPSRWEGFGMVFLEAMAAGLPIVATQAGSIPEIVEHGKTGLLVPADDAQALYGAICTLLEKRQLAHSMGEAGRLRLDKDFTVTAMVEGTCAVYADLLAEGSQTLKPPFKGVS